ncbi:MAG: glycosyltransferase [Saprospiraceae bacterium]|nr:glycosyltransferase [Saprospiraceae bacterium]
MVSVVIPVYNQKAFVEKMIKCIIKQTYSDWELILIDDGSMDGTYEMMLDYSATEHRIQVARRHRLPKGAPTCRNIGMDKAVGEYIVIFDSDDIISRECLEQRVEFMDTIQAIDFGVFPAKSFGHSVDIKRVSFHDTIWGSKENKDDLSLFLSAKYPFTVWTNIYRRESLVLNKIRWDEKVEIYQDFDFIISSLMCGLKYEYAYDKVAGFDYFYRMGFSSNTISAQHFSDAKVKSTIYLFSKVLNSLKDSKRPRHYRHKVYSYILRYFKTIIINRAFEHIPMYLQFCKKYYSSLAVSRLRILSSILQCCQGRSTFKLFYTGLFCLMYPKSEIYERIVDRSCRIRRMRDLRGS